MPTQSVSTVGVVVNQELVSALGEIIRPYSVPVYMQWVLDYREHSFEHLSDAQTQETIDDAKRRAEAGGDFSIAPSAWVLDSRDITWHFGNELDLSLHYFDDVVEAEFMLRPGHHGSPTVHVRSTRYSTTATVSGEIGELESVVPAVQKTLKEFVDADLLEAASPPFRVFIGHGGDRQWEAVRRFVESQYEVAAFETHDRLGQQAFEVVENMISEASVAVIVMTATDDRADGKRTARQNVVHELGFAQGRLGARNTIIVVESGTELFTNIESIQQVRFAPGEIHTIEDTVLAALANRKREIDERDRGSA